MAKKSSDKSLSAKLTPAWELNDLYVNLNGQELCDIDIQDYECLYGGCRVIGRLKFIDSKGHLTGDNPDAANIQVGGFVDVGFTTSENCQHEESFSITKVTTINNKRNQKLVILDLVDIETKNMLTAFKSKGYPNTKFSDAIKKHMTEIGNDGLRFGKEFVLSAPKMIEEKMLNMVVPGHINFHEFLNIEMAERGFNYVKDRAKNYLVHAEHREFDKLIHTFNEFEYDALNEFDFNRIVQFDIDGYNSEGFECSIATSNTSLNPLDANSEDAVISTEGTDSKISKKKSEESKNDSNISGVKASSLANAHRGSKQGSKIGGDQQYFSKLSNATKANIWVPGRVDNLVGKKIKANFPKPTYYADSGEDQLFSGDWEVYMVRDKIISGYYLNELFLRRPGGSVKK